MNTKYRLLLTATLFAAFVIGTYAAERLSIRRPEKKAAYVAAVADSQGTDSQIKWSDIKANLDAVGTALDAIDLGSSTNAVWSGNQKIYLVNLKDNVQSLKVAVKNLMQAANQSVKKQKQMEENRKAAGL